MLRKKHFVWLLVVALLLSLSMTGLAVTTEEQVDNADGSYTVIRKTDGVLEAKSYYAADGELVQHENYDAAGALTSKYVYDGDTTQSTEYYPDGTPKSEQINSGATVESKSYNEAGVLIDHITGTGANTYWLHYHENGTLALEFESTEDTNSAKVYSTEGVLTNENSNIYIESMDSWVAVLEVYYNDAGVKTRTDTREYSEAGDVLAYQKQEYYEDGNTRTLYSDKADGSSAFTSYYEDGSVNYARITNADGSGESKSYYSDGKLSEATKTQANGAEELISYNRDGQVDYSYVQDENGLFLEIWNEYQDGVLTGKTEGTLVDGKPELRVFVSDVNGELQLVSIEKRTVEDGKFVTEFSYPNEEGEFVPTSLNISYEKEDGTNRSENYSINAQGERTLENVAEVSLFNGVETTNRFTISEQGEEVLIGVTVWSDDDAGSWLREEYEVQADGQQILVEKHSSIWNEAEGKREDQKMQLVDGQLIVTEQMITLFNEDGGYTIDTYELNEQGELVLVSSQKFDQDGNEIEEEEEELPPQKVFTWYPSNTASSAGFSFRNLRPELTDKWYNFTPIDLGQDGTTIIPLVAGNVYIVGKIEVKVAGDEVVVGYSLYGAGSDTARMESEFFTFFANLDSVTTVTPEDLGEGYKFGEPISIQNDLQGDTKVLLFVRNVLTFRDYYTGDRQLARYWPNSKNYNDYYDYLRSIMD